MVHLWAFFTEFYFFISYMTCIALIGSKMIFFLFFIFFSVIYDLFIGYWSIIGLLIKLSELWGSKVSYKKSDFAAEKIQTISVLLNELKNEFAADERNGSTFAGQHKIDSFAGFGMQLNERRKALGIDLYTLELQTGVSASTLKRLFKDPEQVKFGSVYVVAEALGMKLCAVV